MLRASPGGCVRAAQSSAVVASPVRSRSPPSCSRTRIRLGPKPRSRSRAATSAGVPAVRAEHQEPSAVVQGGGQTGGGPADEGDDLGVLQWPAEAGRRVGDGGGVRQDAQPVTGLLGEGAADAVEHGVAAGQDGDPAACVRGEQGGDGGAQGRGPGDPLARALRGQQVELPWAPDQHLGVPQDRPVGVGDTRPAVGAEPDDGDGVRRSWSCGGHCAVPRRFGGGSRG